MTKHKTEIIEPGWEMVVVGRNFLKMFLYEKYFKVDTDLSTEQTYQKQKLVMVSLLGCPRLC